MTRLQATFIRSSPGFMEEANQRAEVRDKRDRGQRYAHSARPSRREPGLLFDNKALSLGSGIHYSVITS